MYSWIEILRCSAPQNDIVPTREHRLARDSSLRYIQNDTSVIPNRGLSTECEESLTHRFSNVISSEDIRPTRNLIVSSLSGILYFTYDRSAYQFLDRKKKNGLCLTSTARSPMKDNIHYLTKSSSRYLGNVHKRSSTANSSLSIWYRISSSFGAITS